MAVFFSNNEQIFFLLFEIMISQVCKPFRTLLVMLKIFLKFGKLSRSFFIFVCPPGERGPRMSLMIKAHSSQDCQRIRILSIIEREKASLPVDIRHSKTSLLKLPNAKCVQLSFL